MDFATKFASLRQLPPEQLVARASEILPPWVTIILVIAVAWQLARITWLLVPQQAPTVTPITVDAAALMPAAMTGGAINTERINQVCLFGCPSARENPGPKEPVIDAPIDSELTLRGIISDVAPELGLAIISEQGGEEKVYKVGDSLPKGRRLHSVYSDKVFLMLGTQMRQLTLPKEFGSSSSRRPPAQATSRARSSQRSLREVISTNPARLTDIIRPQPVFVDGKQRGYRVYPGRQRQQFSALGLKPGDLVIEINGTALDDPARGMEVFRSLGDATQVSVTVERNGQPEVLMLDTEVLQQGSQPGVNQ